MRYRLDIKTLQTANWLPDEDALKATVPDGRIIIMASGYVGPIVIAECTQPPTDNLYRGIHWIPAESNCGKFSIGGEVSNDDKK